MIGLAESVVPNVIPNVRSHRGFVFSTAVGRVFLWPWGQPRNHKVALEGEEAARGSRFIESIPAYPDEVKD
jgi:hypothetical protein